MSKVIDIKGSSLVRHDMPGNHIRIVASDDVSVTTTPVAQVDAPGNAPAADSSASGNAAAGALLSGGSGGYAGGGVGGAAPERRGQPAGVTEIPFVNGGVLSLPYPQANQRRWILTGVTAGMCALNLGTIALGRHPGVAKISIVAEDEGDCSTEIAIATVPGVFIGDDVLEAWPQHPEQSLNFQVGQNIAGNGPRVPTDKETIVNVRFFGTPASRVLVEIAAHDQV